MAKFPPFNDKVTLLLHGADYNPDQWLDSPEVLEEDIRLMNLSKSNVMSVGIFSWASLEPEEGVFQFEWLDDVLDRFAANGLYAFLATPSGARPAWMAQKYPEVLRVSANRIRNLYGLRHNHCYTSPKYREKVYIINRKLAERYAFHPAVVGWHISNEYGGECHCDLCQEAFRNWLKQKYATLENLNKAWWTTFWSHVYTDWSQLESPAPHGESGLHGLNLDWKRFVTHQTVDFCRHEIEPIRGENPALPVTTNFMELYQGLNYWKFKDLLDVISWDSYPTWHDAKSIIELGSRTAMIHDMHRSFKNGKPFLLMESTPSATNWQTVSKLKRPGVHLLTSLQAVAHGADSVQYFQWRKSRGSLEKFHGAVVDHVGHEHTRIFHEVTQVGKVLEKLSSIVGTSVEPEVAVIFDWENFWAIGDAKGPRNAGMKYEETVVSHYRTFWESGVPVDVIDMECNFDNYKLLVAPMLYMVRPGVAEKVEAFVRKGGTFVTTYWSGIVDDHDLCFLGGVPGPLRQTLGIWSEEIDALYDTDENRISIIENNSFHLKGSYKICELCDLIHAEAAEVLGVYESDFYEGRPALTVNHYGLGRAYYIAARTEQAFYRDFYQRLIQDTNVVRVFDAQLPPGVTAQMRSDGQFEYVFLMNFGAEDLDVELDDCTYFDMLTLNELNQQETVETRSRVSLAKYGVRVLRRTVSHSGQL